MDELQAIYARALRAETRRSARDESWIRELAQILGRDRRVSDVTCISRHVVDRRTTCRCTTACYACCRRWPVQQPEAQALGRRLDYGPILAVGRT